MERQKSSDSINRGNRNLGNALRTAVAAFALMATHNTADAARVPQQHEQNASTAHELPEEEKARQKNQERGVWNMESEHVVNFLFRRCLESAECETVRKAFSEQEILHIKEYMILFVQRAFNRGYDRPAAVFAEQSNKKEMRTDLDAHFLKNARKDESMLGALAINDLLHFLFKNDLAE